MRRKVVPFDGDALVLQNHDALFADRSSLRNITQDVLSVPRTALKPGHVIGLFKNLAQGWEDAELEMLILIGQNQPSILGFNVQKQDQFFCFANIPTACNIFCLTTFGVENFASVFQANNIPRIRVLAADPSNWDASSAGGGSAGSGAPPRLHSHKFPSGPSTPASTLSLMNSGNVFAQAAGSFGQSTHHAMKAVHGMTFLLHLCQGNQELAIRLFGATGNLDSPTIREVFAQACREKGELALLNLEATSSANFKKILEGKIGEGPGCLLLRDFAVKGYGKSSTFPPNLAQVLQLLDAITQVYRLLVPGSRNLIQLGLQL